MLAMIATALACAQVLADSPPEDDHLTSAPQHHEEALPNPGYHLIATSGQVRIEGQGDTVNQWNVIRATVRNREIFSDANDFVAIGLPDSEVGDRERDLLGIGGSATDFGEPTLVVSSWSRGSCCPWTTITVVALGSAPRVLGKKDFTSPLVVLESDGVLAFLDADTNQKYRVGRDGFYRASKLAQTTPPAPSDVVSAATRYREEYLLGGHLQSASLVARKNVFSIIRTFVMEGHAESAWAFLETAFPDDIDGRIAIYRSVMLYVDANGFWDDVEALNRGRLVPVWATSSAGATAHPWREPAKTETKAAWTYRLFGSLEGSTVECPCDLVRRLAWFRMDEAVITVRRLNKGSIAVRLPYASADSYAGRATAVCFKLEDRPTVEAVEDAWRTPEKSGELDLTLVRDRADFITELSRHEYPIADRYARCLESQHFNGREFISSCYIRDDGSLFIVRFDTAQSAEPTICPVGTYPAAVGAPYGRDRECDCFEGPLSEPADIFGGYGVGGLAKAREFKAKHPLIEVNPTQGGTGYSREGYFVPGGNLAIVYRWFSLGESSGLGGAAVDYVGCVLDGWRMLSNSMARIYQTALGDAAQLYGGALYMRGSHLRCEASECEGIDVNVFAQAEFKTDKGYYSISLHTAASSDGRDCITVSLESRHPTLVDQAMIEQRRTEYQSIDGNTTRDAGDREAGREGN